MEERGCSSPALVANLVFGFSSSDRDGPGDGRPGWRYSGLVSMEDYDRIFELHCDGMVSLV